MDKIKISEQQAKEMNNKIKYDLKFVGTFISVTVLTFALVLGLAVLYEKLYPTKYSLGPIEQRFIANEKRIKELERKVGRIKVYEFGKGKKGL